MSKNMHLNDKNMHPDDKKNMFIFLVACIGMFLLYDIFISQPQTAKIRAEAEQAALQASVAMASPQTKSLTRDDAVNGGGRIEIKSETLSGSFNLSGARFDDLSLNNYKEEPNGEKIIDLLNPIDAPHSYYGEFGWLSSDPSLKMPSKDTRWYSRNRTLAPDAPISLQWNNGQGLRFTKDISLDDKYMFTVKQSVHNASRKPITLYPFALIGRDGLPEKMANAVILHEGPIGYIGDELHEVDYDDLDDQENVSVRAKDGWIGITDKYWLTALTVGKSYKEEIKYRFVGEPIEDDKTHYQADLMGSAITLQPGEVASIPIEFFAGPKIVSMLEDYADEYDIPHFDLAVDFGILYFLTRPFYEILTFLNNIFDNFAISLLVFTVFIKLCVFPLAQKSYRSFARMRKVTPQMVELRKQHGDDRVKLQAAIFALYKKENVNPMAGCFPIIIQIPIFFSLYKVFFVNIGMRHQPFWGWVEDMSAMDPTNLVELFGLMPWDAPSFMHIGAWPIIMGLTMALQQRLNPPPQDKTQRIVMGIMPFWLVIILGKFPVGLVIYWSWSNTLSILQQYVLLRQEGVKVNIFTRSRQEKDLEDLLDKGPDVHPEMEILDHEDIEPETKKIKPKKRRKKK